jgi:hypothetical protein
MTDKVEAYPYFKLSLAWNVPHGTVLCFASAYQKRFTNLDCWERQATDELQLTDLGTRVIHAYHTEMERRIG